MSDFRHTLCPTCGKPRMLHVRGPNVCSVPPEVTERLRQFSAENGKRWKSILSRLWLRGEDEGLLRQARNMIGPSGIYKIKL